MDLNILKEIIKSIENSLIIKGKTPWQFEKNQEILKTLNNKYNCFKSVTELLYLLNNKNNLENLHIFCKCGNKNTFLKEKSGYSKHCSYSCAANDENCKNNRLIGMNKKYGVDYAMQSKELKQKYKNNYIKNYGVDNPRKNPIIIKYIKKRMLEQNDLGKTKYEIVVEKRKKKNLEKYGVENYTQTSEYKNKYKNKDFVKSIVEKRYNTKIKNKSYNNRSKEEIECFNLLKTKFPDAKHSYYDKMRYPFNCDMYIPSQDLFIECHFYWKHGPYKNNCHEPFNSNNEKHQNIITVWKNKNTKNYYNAIKVWTESDPLKLETFKKNKLNYKIFYSKKDFMEWFNNAVTSTR